jgi:hypothetical protein
MPPLVDIILCPQPGQFQMNLFAIQSGTSDVMLFADFVANDAADRRATHRAGSASAGQDRAAHSADTGANRGISILRRHSGTAQQAEQHGYCCRIHC